MIRTLYLWACMLIATHTIAAPNANLIDERWLVHGDKIQINHKLWDDWLANYVITDDPSGIHLVDYAAVTPADAKALKQYIQQLEKLPISQYTRQAQYAYWVNLYNAKTVEIILSNYPIASILDVKLSNGGFMNRLTSKGPWKTKVLKVEEVSLSLDDIEHGILRPIWREPRTHYALNCASRGCPSLLPIAFNEKNTQALLDSAAKDFINHPRGTFIEGKVLTLSKLYDWYGEDFGHDKAELIKHLKGYASPNRQSQLNSDLQFEYDYDWSLNGLMP